MSRATAAALFRARPWSPLDEALRIVESLWSLWLNSWWLNRSPRARAPLAQPCACPARPAMGRSGLAARRTKVAPEYGVGYVDIHSHVLYGLDDGPKTAGESLAMLEQAAAAGTTDIVATPHANGRYAFSPELIDQRIA